MAGHSKWANIKHRKAAQDAKKGKIYAKCSREIMKAAKLGGPDPAANFRLRTAIERAKASGLPNDNIQRAIDKGSGTGEADNLESLTYEGYGPGGVAVFIETETDNRNRTAGDIRSYFNKYEGNLGADGCVAWMFDEKGLIRLPAGDTDEEILMEHLVSAGASDFEHNTEDNVFEVFTEPTQLQAVCEALNTRGVTIKSAEMTRIPQNSVSIEDEQHATTLMKLLEAIENHEDVQNVYANFEMEDSLLEKLSG